MDIMEEFKPLCDKIEPCGSRITCTPPPTDTDRDFIVLAGGLKFEILVTRLHGAGWELGGSDCEAAEDQDMHQDAKFNSFKKGVDNLIVTQSENFYNRFVAATHVSKRLNLLKKEDRIALFQAVLYANCA